MRRVFAGNAAAPGMALGRVRLERPARFSIDATPLPEEEVEAEVARLERAFTVDQIEKAKSVCGRCSVTEMCLQYALETNQDSGVWGGLSEDERRALKRRAARARRAS